MILIVNTIQRWGPNHQFKGITKKSKYYYVYVNIYNQEDHLGQFQYGISL